MSSDLARLESASALRTWEESRKKRFVVWRDAINKLIEGLRGTIKHGVAQHQKLDQFLRQRSAADKAYASALKSLTVPQIPQKDSPATVTQPVKSPLLQAILEIQKSISVERETFATNILENTLLNGLMATTAEFERTGNTLLQGLEASLAEVVENHDRATRTMATYHRVSIEGGRRQSAGSGGGSAEPQSDEWLHEHRYRRAVMLFCERQRKFTMQLCTAVEEARKLEEWREEMARKVLGKFCTKFHQMETAVQSLSNDGVRALAGLQRDPGERAVLSELENVLRKVHPLPAGFQPPPPSPTQTAQEEWPALQQLGALSYLSKPPPSVLVRTGGPLQVPRRWYGNQLSIAVLTKDEWLHCFHVSVSKSDNGKAKSPKSTARAKSSPPVRGGPSAQVSASSSATGHTGAVANRGGNTVGATIGREDYSNNRFDALDAMEDEPQWSMHLPGASITASANGRAQCFEVEEVRRGFLGLRSAKRELLQAESEQCMRQWVAALTQSAAGQQNRDAVEGQQQPVSRGTADSHATVSTPAAAVSTLAAKEAVVPKSTSEADAIATTTPAGVNSATIPGVVSKTSTAGGDLSVSMQQHAPPPPPPPPPPPLPTSPRPQTPTNLTAEDVFGE